MTTTFDTLKYAETLQSAGFTEAQAKGQAQALAEVLREGFGELVTKGDMTSLRTELVQMEHRLTERMDAGDARLLERINASQTQLIERMDAGDTRLLERMDAGDTRLLERINASQTQLIERIDAGDTRLFERINKVEERLTQLQGRMGLVQWMIGFCIALVVLVLGILLRGF